eukprot:CAMPEP_0175808034 /NCGR_PEP_ID=MMETSP0107_2-20121207/2043_1 /TAXON_ID=195067 ORGANISM="Goniomonas pacifica, Strain CCMP1869" /NCGR_SAMPLE_ID=MMETSP0107_2 /ASSEMBLY_ACC=CAM_ASM_000203 /LENGTH=56 /DNA_ID=CAMNT_0017119633 /DNA_START=10 /DNA_END=180 /DNA_ORIENTATION=+
MPYRYFNLEKRLSPNTFDGQGSGHTFMGSVWSPGEYVNNSDGGRSGRDNVPDYRQA